VFTAHAALPADSRLREMIDTALYSVSPAHPLPGREYGIADPPPKLDAPHRLRVELASRYQEYTRDKLITPADDAAFGRMMESAKVKRVGTPGEVTPFDPVYHHAPDHGVSSGAPVKVVASGWTGLYGGDHGHETTGKNWLRAIVEPA
jgi:hypothetical protein